MNEVSLGILAEIVQHSRNLVDLDISWNGLKPNNNLKKFLEALGHNRTIQYLNLSWNNLMLPPPIVKEPLPPPNERKPMIVIQPEELPVIQEGEETLPTEEHEAVPSATIMATNKKEQGPKLDEYNQSLLDNLSRFIKYNKSLIHLDLSYTRLDEMMVKALGTALRRAKSLVAVHFTGNPGACQNNAEYL
jgi:hypothetical protein